MIWLLIFFAVRPYIKRPVICETIPAFLIFILHYLIQPEINERERSQTRSRPCQLTCLKLSAINCCHSFDLRSNIPSCSSSFRPPQTVCPINLNVSVMLAHAVYKPLSSFNRNVRSCILSFVYSFQSLTTNRVYLILLYTFRKISYCSYNFNKNICQPFSQQHYDSKKTALSKQETFLSSVMSQRHIA